MDLKMKYRGKRIDNGEVVYGNYFHNFRKGESHNIIDYDSNEWYEVEKESVSLFFGKKDKNGKDIYTNDKVRYDNKEYYVKYFEEYGAFGLYDEVNGRPLGRRGSSTKYEPYFMNDYHTKKMEII